MEGTDEVRVFWGTADKLCRVSEDEMVGGTWPSRINNGITAETRSPWTHPINKTAAG
jgi:hypothetical protein